MASGKIRVLHVNVEGKVNNSYNLMIGYDIFDRISKDLTKLKLNSLSKAIITDDNLIKYGYAKKLKSTLENSEVFSFKPGEKSKTVGVCLNLINQMSKRGFGRGDSLILALGGGVVGDVAGFTAGIFNRGIPYVQIPTTTLSQSDASIGGKTGVNTVNGKNLIGVFKQPKAVYIDVKTLETLPKEEYISGLSETVKHAVIKDKKFFNYLNDNADKILKRDRKTLIHIAVENCKIKGSVVERDPEEKGYRRILNYGHTIGHAIEKSSNYRINHGNAVSLGMVVEGRLAVDLGFLPENALQLQIELLNRLKLQTKIPFNISIDGIIEAARFDKKNRKGEINCSIPSRIGEMNRFSGNYAVNVIKVRLKEVLKKSLVFN
jgi:3-dehydroquinate synthase